MQNNIFVLDANVFLEYIFDRPLCECSKRIFNDAILEKIDILLPSLVLDEITEVLCGNLNELYIVEQYLQFIEELAKNNILTIVVPDTFVRMKAIEIARTGNKKSGFPELTDCLYYALAIVNNGLFVTNDKKHMSKVHKFRPIIELESYS